ncbi:MAG: hypothetical protein AAGH40_11065 [Verrucomicrobiota bacterium]
MDMTRGELLEAFKAAKAARESIEVRPEPERVSKFDREWQKGTSLYEVENINQPFNEAAQGKNAPEQVSKDSDMIKGEKNTPELKPKSPEREQVDRDTHNEKMKKDDQAAKEALRLAEQLQKRDDFGKDQSRNMGMSR